MKTILITQLTIILMVIPGFSWAQLITVSGYVNNSTNGQAMKNVSIFESNSGIGTITNQYGFYKLTLEKGQLNLKISDNGFKSYTNELNLASDTTLMVKLEPNLHLKAKHKKEQELHAGVETDKKTSNRRGFKLF